MVSAVDSEFSFAFTYLSISLHVVLLRTLFLQYVKFVFKNCCGRFFSSLSEIFFSNRASSIVVQIFSICTVGLFKSFVAGLILCT